VVTGSQDTWWRKEEKPGPLVSSRILAFKEKEGLVKGRKTSPEINSEELFVGVLPTTA